MRSGNIRLKLACYFSNLTMSVVSSLSPILFLPFHNLYNISYSLLGLLILINFITQLAVDLLFSFFSHKLPVAKIIKLMPAIAVVGLVLYAICPFVFPGNIYWGLLFGTVIFSAASGLGEVLISPVIAAIPSKDPGREMSKLHSIYAWGVVFVIIIGTMFLYYFGHSSWPYLAILYAIIPLVSYILFTRAQIPETNTNQDSCGMSGILKQKRLWLCVAAIFLGGASECTMSQWNSGYLELALGIPKVWGDIFGAAVFALMLGLGRTLYAKYGKNIRSILLLCSVGAFICYFTAAISNIPTIGLAACAFTGLCVSMLWPGCLIVAAEYFPSGGVFLYAMMAAGGDFGASIAPQLIGLITDRVQLSSYASSVAQNLGITAEQLGMRLGLLSGSLFPLTAILLFCKMNRSDQH